jgi:hypothetical protein
MVAVYPPEPEDISSDIALYTLVLKPWLRIFRSCIYMLNLLTEVWTNPQHSHEFTT